MARANKTAAATPQKEGLPENEQLVEFCAALAKRFPERLIKRFTMPSSVRECREVFIREITSKDEIQAAIYADATMSAVEKASNRLSNDAERRESVRISICGIGVRRGGVNAPDDAPIDYRHVGEDGVPFDAPTTWSTRAWAALSTYFGEVNGVPFEELASGIMEARAVGAYASPTSETLASADRGR